MLTICEARALLTLLRLPMTLRVKSTTKQETLAAGDVPFGPSIHGSRSDEREKEAEQSIEKLHSLFLLFFFVALNFSFNLKVQHERW